MSLNIYEYDRRFPAAENELTYFVGDKPPLAGGYTEDEREENDKLFPLAATAESFKEAEDKIVKLLYENMPGCAMRSSFTIPRGDLGITGFYE